MKRTALIVAAVSAGLLALVLLPHHAALGWLVACVALFVLSDRKAPR